MGQTLRRRISLANDHQVHPRQLLPGQPGGQRLPTGQLPVAGDRRHVPAAGRAATGSGRGGGGSTVKVDGGEASRQVLSKYRSHYVVSLKDVFYGDCFV